MPLKKGDIKVGDKVVFVGPKGAPSQPPIGTIGIFVRDDGSDCPMFEWPDGTVPVGFGRSYCSYFRLERAPVTQADKIISEGAKGLAKLFKMACSPVECTGKDIDCDTCIMNWLLSEVEE